MYCCLILDVFNVMIDIIMYLINFIYKIMEIEFKKINIFMFGILGLMVVLFIIYMIYFYI